MLKCRRPIPFFMYGLLVYNLPLLCLGPPIRIILILFIKLEVGFDKSYLCCNELTILRKCLLCQCSIEGIFRSDSPTVVLCSVNAFIDRKIPQRQARSYAEDSHVNASVVNVSWSILPWNTTWQLDWVQWNSVIWLIASFLSQVTRLYRYQGVAMLNGNSLLLQDSG